MYVTDKIVSVHCTIKSPATIEENSKLNCQLKILLVIDHDDKTKNSPVTCVCF